MLEAISEDAARRLANASRESRHATKQVGTKSLSHRLLFGTREIDFESSFDSLDIHGPLFGDISSIMDKHG
jgi:hypothetical protein